MVLSLVVLVSGNGWRSGRVPSSLAGCSRGAWLGCGQQTRPLMEVCQWFGWWMSRARGWGSVLPAGNHLPFARMFSAAFIINHSAQDNGQENESWAPCRSSLVSAGSLYSKFFVLFNSALDSEVYWFNFPFYGGIVSAYAPPTLQISLKVKRWSKKYTKGRTGVLHPG